MLTFRRVTMLFFITLLSLNLWNIFSGNSTINLFHAHALLFYALLFILYFGISFVMAFLPCTNFHHRVICHGITDEKLVAITFDDVPNPEKTPVVLDILDMYHVKATFFCIGKNIADHEQLIKRMDEEGHLIGNHSFSHSKWFDLFSSRMMQAEFLKTDQLINKITGKSPLFFRPPFGVVNPMVSNALKNMHWQPVCWNIRSFDTLVNDPEKTMNRILKRLKPGSVILLHDFTPFAQKHLGELISGIQDAGFRIVPLDKMLNMPAYA